jgi:hypothetical protein
MSEQTITGICQEIAQKPGSDWVEFHIDGGGKYPVRLSTKLQPLIELGKAAGQSLATWTYNEIESEKINEKSGKPYVNRYLERVEVGGSVQEPEHPEPEKRADADGSPSSRPPILGGDKDRLIVRQTCIKAAAALLHCNDEVEDLPLDVMKAAQRFETWCYRDLEPPPF